MLNRAIDWTLRTFAPRLWIRLHVEHVRAAAADPRNWHRYEPGRGYTGETLDDTRRARVRMWVCPACVNDDETATCARCGSGPA